MLLEISPYPNPLAPFGVPGISYAMTVKIGTFLIKRPYHPHFIGLLVFFFSPPWLSQDLHSRYVCWNSGPPGTAKPHWVLQRGSHFFLSGAIATFSLYIPRKSPTLVLQHQPAYHPPYSWCSPYCSSMQIRQREPWLQGISLRLVGRLSEHANLWFLQEWAPLQLCNTQSTHQ